MSTKFVGLAAAVLSGLFVVSTSVEPAAARDGGGRGGGHSANSGGGGGGRSISGGGGRNFSGGGGRSFSNRSSPGPRISGDRMGGRTYGYRANSHAGHNHRGHRHHRRYVGVPYGYYDGGYDYSTYNGACAYEYNRAITTGSAYWWSRYQECIE